MMPVLKDILYRVPLLATSGNPEVEIRAIRFDSRQVEPGDLFVAVRGTKVDGHDYIQQAVARGAAAVVSEHPIPSLSPVPFIQVPDSARALAVMASNFYGNPSGKLKLVGVTGTNGKTTTVYLLYRLFTALGYRAGMLTTIVNRILERDIPSTHTTGDAVQIQALLRQMVDQGCTHCFMEVSSHALHQQRVFGLEFDLAVFTNITHDHLDYHPTFQDYIRAKKVLFDQLPSGATALVNADDRNAPVMVQNTRATVHTFGLRTMSDFKSRVITNSLHGLEMELDGRQAWFRLIGDFNAYNLTAVYASAVLLGGGAEKVLTALSSLTAAPGRFEYVPNPAELVAIVDYAHTPDALRNVLETITKTRSGKEKIITVVGCGGNRDKGKRPVMASIACRFSDQVLLTSDNPRDEDPLVIIAEMKAGIRKADEARVLSIVDRREAIRTAVALAQPGDVLLVAGKGHEEYQEIAGVRSPFSDRDVLREAMETKKKKS
jgi:UDP-N-acetylmuramoyl-L-alanyl-D-glutamate--2,6-diaminopimelate ligase